MGWRRVVCAGLLALGSCRKPQPPAVQDAALAVTSATVVSPIAPPMSGPAAPDPALAPPPQVECTESPSLRWELAPSDAFACSPFRGKASELVLAPGTVLRVKLQPLLHVGKPDAAGASPGPVTYLRQVLPKGAWIDEPEQTLKWRATGADGEVHAFSVAATTDLKEGKRCVKASLVVRIHDDESTRAAQVASLVRDALGADDKLGGSDDPLAAEKLAAYRCGGGDFKIEMVDIDGDGLADALATQPRPHGAALVLAWLRKGEGFTRIGEAVGRAHRTKDGAVFVFDLGSTAPVVSMDGWRVWGNRLEKLPSLVVEGATGTGCGGLDCVELTHDGKHLVGYLLRDAAGKPTLHRWDGKRFLP